MDSNYLKARLEQTRQKQLHSSNKPNSPSLGRMALNAGQSLARNVVSVAQGNSLKIDAGQANHRLSICNQCEFFQKTSQRCNKCGCFLSVKTYLKAEKCPIGKW